MENSIPQQTETSTAKKVFLALGIIFLVGFLLIMAVNLQTSESIDLQSNKAPEFTLSLFDQFEQEQVSLANLRGQVVVVNFWASWCVECYKEAELLEQTWREFKDEDVVFIGVDHLDTEKEALAYMAKYGITYPSGPDVGDKISDDYHITGVPETFFIDKDGNIAHVQIGPIGKQELYDLIDKLIAQPYQGT